MDDKNDETDKCYGEYPADLSLKAIHFYDMVDIRDEKHGHAYCQLEYD